MTSAAAVPSLAEVAAPQIRIFPHSPDEFPSDDLLRIWLLNGLRGNGGRYHLPTADRMKDLTVGSVGLFRYGTDYIVGEAIVQKEVENEQGTEKNQWTGKEQRYEAVVTFAPSSIRLYSPPLNLNRIKDYVKDTDGKDVMTFAGGRYILKWDTYARMLKEVVSAGAFIS